MRGAPSRTLVLLAACLAVSPPLALGCGYQLVRYRDALGDARSVAILGVRNETLEPGVDSLVTDALQREFLRRGALRIVQDADAADLVIGGAVERLATRSLAFSSIQFAVEYEVTLELDLEVRRRDGSPVPLDPRGLAETELYLSSADVESARKNRQEALRRLSSLLAERVHDALFERLAP